jgi:DNA excision repair protein ERCC-2
MKDFSKYFPYKLRTFQSEIMESISNTLESDKHIILESGTGTGKTICTIVPVLSSALENDKRILYCTRTNSQQRQVMSELRAIKRHLGINDFNERCLGLGIQGRHNLCLLTMDEQELKISTAEELAKLCTDRKNSTLVSFEGGTSTTPDCRYYRKILEADLAEVKKWIRTELPSAEDISEYCSDIGLCPYELIKSLLQECRLVAAPYIYFLQPFIRRRLLEWLNCNIEDLIIVVDEAHNLPDYARELGSHQLGINTLKIANEEALEFGDPTITDGMSATYMITKLEDIIWDMKNEYVMDEDGFIPPDELQVQLMSRLKVISNKLRVIIKNLLIAGEIVRDKRRKFGRLPRSYLYSTARFLEFWLELEAETHVKLIVNEDEPKLEAYCLDPSTITSVLNECFASIHISGTLQPLEEYRDSIGLSADSLMETFPSPFPEENRRVYYANDVNTRFETMKSDEKVLIKIENYIKNICNNYDRNTIVFFPSFKLLNQFLHRGLHFTLRRKFFIEQRNMGQRRLMELINTFKSERGVLFGVMGGRLSEGIDFPGSELEIVILVGIPYPKPTARQKALQNYYDKKFDKGWEYTVHAPTQRKILQSIGRLIRTEEDKGLALILDHRAIQFKNQLEGLSIMLNVRRSLVDLFQNDVD